jgi:peptidyl-dipeptidase A
VLKSDDYKFQSFAGKKEVGDYLKAKIFMPGSRWYWNEMIEKATGEKLTAKYYAKQFVN